MLAKGKAPKVLIAAARQEPVVDISEGSEAFGASVTRPFTGQSLTTQPVESRPYFTARNRNGGCETDGLTALRAVRYPSPP